MENTYRFLMMAATLIVGILLLSMLVYVFRAGARASKAVDEAQIEQQMIAENAKFEHYNRVENTSADMISLVNLVYSYNKTRDFVPEDCVNVIIYIGQPDSRYFYIGEDTSIPQISRSSSLLQRNQVWYTDEANPLAVNEISERKNVTDITFNKMIFSEDTRSVSMDGTQAGNADDTLSLTRYDSLTGRTIYKYLFMASSYTYDINSGRIKTMKFRACINGDY